MVFWHYDWNIKPGVHMTSWKINSQWGIIINKQVFFFHEWEKKGHRISGIKYKTIQYSKVTSRCCSQILTLIQSYQKTAQGNTTVRSLRFYKISSVIKNPQPYITFISLAEAYLQGSHAPYQESNSKGIRLALATDQYELAEKSWKCWQFVTNYINA